MTESNADTCTILNTAMLAALLILNAAWHYKVL